ncbi:MAG TPA: hypothetical protein EYP58_04960 [bacterium (Candidatus Stahlbacteria)]|nr:hypothetical protein [Candidatus Stahlbacteria bacterium]
MGSCQYRDKILDYRLGLLDAGDEKAFQVHLESCPICRKELQVESEIDKELSAELEPGAIEHLVIARLRLLKSADPATSLFELIRMGIYAAASIIGGFVILPIILKIPYKVLSLDFSIFSQLGNYLNTFINTHIIIIGLVGVLFLISSTILSLRIIRE